MPVGPIENEGGKLKSIENGWSVNIPFFGKGGEGGKFGAQNGNGNHERGARKKNPPRDRKLMGCGDVGW